MNSKKHKLPRRILAMLLAICMFVTMFPSAMFAVDETGHVDEVTTLGDSGIQIEKSVKKDADGNLSLVIDAWATGEKQVSETVNPVDIVLVLDQSGSMADGTGNTVESYSPAQKQSWSYSDFGWRREYYVLVDDEYCRVTRHDQDYWEDWYYSHTEYWLTYEKDGEVYDLSSERTTDRDDILYEGTLYTRSTSSVSKVSALQSAVESFIQSVNNNPASSDETHKIAIVGFADNQDSGNYNNTELFIGSSEYRYNGTRWNDYDDRAQNYYSQALQASNSENLQASIDALDANGSTYPSYGIEMANGILDTVQDPSNEREKVIIVFTDGHPGYNNNSYDSDEAERAVAQANSARQKGTTVYSVGVFNSSDVNNPTVQQFMTDLAGSEERFLSTSDTSGLNEIFEKIADEIGQPNVEADESSVLTDVLSKYFTVDNVDSGREITVQTVPYNGKDNEKGEWGLAKDSDLEAKVVDGKNISVTGFDYSKNYVWDTDSNHGGEKLRLTIPIKPDTDCTDWGESGYYDTNASTEVTYGESGIVSLDDSPNALVKTYTVSYNWGTENVPGNVALPINGAYYITGQTYTVDPTYTNTTVIEVTDDNGNVTDRYTFSGWTDPNNGTISGDNVTITGSWNHETVTVEKYPVTYSWSGLPEEGTKLYDANGSEVTLTLPTDLNKYAPNETYSVDSEHENGMEVYTRDEYGNVNGTYTFSGWNDPNEGKMDNDGVTITGTWTFIPQDVNKYTVSYSWTGLPDDTTFYNDKGETVTLEVPDSASYVPGQTYTVDKDYFKDMVVYTQDQNGNKTASYTFSGWMINGTGEVVTEGKPMPEANVSLSGIWTEQKWYAVSYNANGGTGEMKDENSPYLENTEVTVLDNAFTRDGYTFIEWNTEEDGSGTAYKKNEKFIITGPVTLYAQWAKNATYVDNISKELVDTDEEKQAAQADPYKIDVNNYDYPVDNVVTIPDGEKVTLLYAITVSGDEGASFTVEDNGATLVAQGADKPITADNGKFSGTIPDGDSITFYVSKEFGVGDVNGEGMLVNTATVSGDLKDPENPPTIDEEVPAEPELPTKNEVNALFNVVLDCSVVDSHDTTFEDLIDESYKFGDIKYADGSYTVDMTVYMDDYLQYLNGTKPVHHDVDREEFKTVTLTYKDDGDQAGWIVVGEADPAELTTITFQVKCDGTGGYGINDFTKDIVNGETEKADAVAVIGEDKINEYVIPEEETDTITIPFNGEVTLLYKLTVTGNEKTDASFVVTDKGATFVKAVGDAQITVDPEKAGVFSGTVLAGGSVSFYVSKTFTGEDINGEGKLVNTALIAGANGDATDPDIDEITETVPGDEADPAGTITVTPANLTIYEGGNGGYDAVVDENGETVDAGSSTSLPHPLFEITGIEDPTQLTFINGDNVWKVVSDGGDLYHFEATEDDMDPVRITYTNGDEVITSDTFVPTTDSYVEYQMHIYAGEDAADPSDYSSVTAINGNDRYAVKADGEGILTVRAVDAEDPDTVVSEVTDAAPTTDVAEGTAVAVEPAEGTTYTLNDTDVVVNETDSKPSLLFDGIIDDNVANRTEMLEDKVDEALGGADADREYEIKYIDLVDANNGNAWIASSEGTDIYWGYPEGTDENTDFQILHFKGLHRDGATSGFDPDDLTAIDVDNPEQLENVTITKTEEGIYFHVTEANFSPYALVWETDNGGNQGGGGWTPGGDGDGPDGLNTEDHFSYIVGYAEDYRTGEPTDNEDLWPVKPNNQITRAEVATIFYRLLEDEVRDEYDTTVNDFSDVSADSWYNQTVSTLASMGIVKGYEDGTFRPNAPITRAEFGAIATRFFAETGATYVPGTFSDVTGDEWYANAIQDAVNLGLIGGYPDGTVRPNNNITRAEACAIVNRTLGRVPDADHLLPEDVMKVWPDNNPTDWFYADMQEATNGHEYAWIEEDGHEIEEWTNLLDKDWTDR